MEKNASNNILEIRDLHTSFITYNGEVKAVRGVDFDLKKGEILGVLGESGSGKSVTALSIERLLSDNGKIVKGSVIFNGEDMAQKSEHDMQKLRNTKLAMVFQDPMTSLNPTLRVETQIIERLRAFNKKLSKKEARERALELLKAVKIPDAEERLHAYPFELSGGMCQRVMFAVAIACNPEVLIADEPTTALDVTIQRQILNIMKDLRDTNNLSVILITHDLGVVAETCERVVVMYGGKIMEEGTVEEIFSNPKHPYTCALKRSMPEVNDESAIRLASIEGTPPSLLHPPEGCPFHARCDHAMYVCSQELPPYYKISDTHRSMCWLLDPDCPDNTMKGGHNE